MQADESNGLGIVRIKRQLLMHKQQIGQMIAHLSDFNYPCSILPLKDRQGCCLHPAYRYQSSALPPLVFS